jgi:acetate kinase
MSIHRESCNALVLNMGSTSLKTATYRVRTGTQDAHADVRECERISVEPVHGAPSNVEDSAEVELSGIAVRLGLSRDAPDIVIHRIVHGGDRPGPVQLTLATLVELDDLATLAPLHQAPALAWVRATTQRWPDARQIGVFDTSWHQTMPEKYRVFPLPYPLFKRGVKRYGFHGLAFQSAMRQLKQDPKLSNGRIVLAHLGGGSSLCAVHEGSSINTTMGMTPLGGVPMATRSGSLDPGVLLHLQRRFGMAADEIDRLLWRESGLNGLSGESGDMRELLASNSKGANRAVDVYVAGIVQGIAAMAGCIQGIDALAFSGGIGTHAPAIRARVVAELEWMGLGIDADKNQAGAFEISSQAATARTFVLPIDEEREMVEAIVAPKR